MSAIRQDAWSDEDDLILAEVTLRHIREGSTQLSAFEEVGERIGRTAAACGFRWNSFVRKKYEAAIQIAKAQRQKRTQLKKHAAVSISGSSSIGLLDGPELSTGKVETFTEETLSIDAVIRFLRQWRNTYQDMNRHIKNLEKELQDKEDELDRLGRENNKLNKQVNEVETDYRVVNDDYKALIQIMDRARKMAFLVEEEEEEKPRFKMDANGNLERVE
ncbi:RsfA family transcriptional regulator [Paenibacillus sp. LMG 31458]|jgi:prespore-specific regulator|uniref:RsfA family transcriptional regulator n=2 Tax=Paenibacillus TaxID=44249 RepID=A0ABX1YZL6_9BACL|nr:MULTISPECIES: RsfA family transcriptional regulator [Paenibacillus]MDF2645247.1 transcription factor, RsfA family [Paenibacillus sp.]MDQ0900164.1 prespore-specific regulator [Paenibacillus sp. V4I7]MDQ0921324.1 prespore-specific regulator [Paenibacillus sp. V4I5]NOU76103.1 RsfA family transcriptional regulator [Paenibacillus phytorum]NOU85148.1 RsfA family transcriptional regulator [Paenibacillus germinis]